MLPESFLIPYSVTDVPSGSFLVFAPHPDDEIFSMGGTLIQASNRGQSITIVYMTNGELGGNADIRIAEAVSVCKSINAEPVFLNIADRSVKANKSLFQQIKKLIIELKPANVFFPSPQEFHVDHRATSVSVWIALQEAKFNGDAYCYEVSRQCDCNILIDITSFIEAKEKLCGLYASQLTENNYIEVVKGINKARTYTLSSETAYAEGFLKINNIYRNQKKFFKDLHEDVFLNTLPNDSPIISYLVRTKNRPELLKRCLISLVNQAYKANLDIVVVNDGGENIDEICAPFRNKFHRLKQVDIPKSIGRSGAANTALINAKGNFINFLDDDDEIDSVHTQVFLNHWRRNNDIEVLYRGVRVLNDDGDLIRLYNEPYNIGRMIFNNFIPIHAVTFTRKFIDIGCRFDENLKSMEDWDFWIQLSRLTDFYHVPRVTASYHLVGSSAASPHMSKIYDNHGYVSLVREKWLPKWSAVELDRMIRFLEHQNEKRLDAEIDSIRQSLTRTLTSEKSDE
ncbi:MAG: PIG-L family deacetylase [Pseudomonadales bacterium]|tara:strand:- start:1582 stop:3117 length:1536 start_codon:yes stop_codon:yes gene_type:complete